MRKRMPPEERRDLLCRAVVEVVRHRGLSNVSLASVAEQAAVSKGLVQYVFSTREEMLTQTLTWVRTNLERRIDERFSERWPLSPQEQLREFLLVLLPRTQDARNEALIGSEAFVMELPDAGAREMFARGYVDLVRGLASLITASGLDGDPDLLARTGLAVVEGISRPLVLGYIDVEAAEDVINAWLDGLSPGSAHESGTAT